LHVRFILRDLDLDLDLAVAGLVTSLVVDCASKWLADSRTVPIYTGANVTTCQAER